MTDRILKKDDIVKLFLINGFTYKGKIIAIDDTFLKVFDFKSDKEMVFPLTSIRDMEVQE